MVQIVDIQKGRHTGASIELRGWIHRTRTIGGKAFDEVRVGIEERCERILRRFLAHRNGLSDRMVKGCALQGDALAGVRGNGTASRMCSSLQIHWMSRSIPMPNPACWTLP